ncbi:MAG: hypothetical protein M1321_01065 [Candidatus Marsarchaeota archaeon]|nr:hypothetical protein [Candidatus Marsarchaeota archaeon]
MASARSSSGSAAKGAGIKINLLALEGLRSMNRYFLYSFISVIISAVLTIAAIATAASASWLLSTFMATGHIANASGVISLVVVTAALMALAMVFSVFAYLSLMFGIRDVRRSSLKSAPAYSSISRWLKWVFVFIVMALVAFGAAQVPKIVSAIKNYAVGRMFELPVALGTGSVGTLGTAGSSILSGTSAPLSIEIVFEAIMAVLIVLWIWKISSLYKILGIDLSQPKLAMAGTLLRIVVAINLVVLALSVTISAYGIGAISSAGSTPAPAAAVAALLEIALAIASIIITAIAYWMGYKSTSAALRTA